MNLKNRYIATIYEDVLKRKTLKQLQRDIYDATINRRVVSKPLTVYAISVGRRAKRLDDGAMGLDLLAVALLDLLNKANVKSQHIINASMTKEESDSKQKLLERMYVENRKWSKKFYVCSMHDDSASDHRPYQGKIYYDDKATYNNKEWQYIYEHHLRSIQFITDAPVYMVTRPNCRHYFVSYTGDNIINGRYTIPHRAVGKRVNSPLAFYSDRLVMYKRLNNIKTTARLKADITRTKSLVNKYSKKH